MALELVQGRDLKEVLRQKGKFSELEAQKLFRQIASAVCYLAEKKIAHRDLKPANMMLSDSNQIKVTDFGTGKVIDSDTDELMSTNCGTPLNQNPQQLLGKKYSIVGDMWSTGTVLF